MLTQDEILENVEKKAQILPKEELEEVSMGANLRNPKPIFINNQLSTQEKEQLVELLKKYVDVFV